jgi:protein-S-isoprenylcysteine O-methyltransferase Ste14
MKVPKTFYFFVALTLALAYGLAMLELEPVKKAVAWWSGVAIEEVKDLHVILASLFALLVAIGVPLSNHGASVKNDTILWCGMVLVGLGCIMEAILDLKAGNGLWFFAFLSISLFLCMKARDLAVKLDEEAKKGGGGAAT